MNFPLCLLVLVAYLSHNILNVNAITASLKKHPYHVNILVSSVHHCSGIIQSERVVVTAASCAYKDSSSEEIPAIQFQIRAGTTNHGGELFGVSEVIRHGEYNRRTRENNIAIFVFDKPLPLNNNTIATIELAEDGPEDGAIGMVTTWGAKARNGADVKTLQAEKVYVVNNKVCALERKGKGVVINEGVFCTRQRYIGQKHVCWYDAGSPFVANGKLAGIVSQSVRCDVPIYPDVFTKISSFQSWLLEQITRVENENKIN